MVGNVTYLIDLGTIWNFSFLGCKKWCYNTIEGEIGPLHARDTLCCTLDKLDNTNIVKLTFGV
jgi:hypothetical protein